MAENEESTIEAPVVATPVNAIVGAIIPNFEKELSDEEERTIGNIRGLLDNNSVRDELVRGKIYAKNKSFVRQVFNKSCEEGIYDVPVTVDADTEKTE